MRMSYSLLLLGQETFARTLLLNDSVNCWQYITIALHDSFKALEHVVCSFRQNHPGRLGFYSGLPKADAVLFWGLPQMWMHYDHFQLKRRTMCRAIITICEVPIISNSDWHFAFRGGGAFTTIVDAPVWKNLYHHCIKRPKSVLIDHWDQDTLCDWTCHIEEWLQDATDEFELACHVQKQRFGELSQQSNTLQMVKQIPVLPFKKWLSTTEHIETFVMTHCESYGYAALDMFARGIRVLCPEPFVPPHFRDKFRLDTFNTKDELIAILRTPPRPLDLMRNKQGLTDWSDVAKLVDDRFQMLLR